MTTMRTRHRLFPALRRIAVTLPLAAVCAVAVRLLAADPRDAARGLPDRRRATAAGYRF